MDRTKAGSIVDFAKAASKAERRLKKMEDGEHNTIRSLQKATQKHDLAVTNLHSAQADVQVSFGAFGFSP